ncbi:RNA-directed DNA polymerase [Pseudaquabacterium rugosum]|uniref:RNA-directed DNA polymerase n=1 Tax=Pseudaquabacterium rugosum TaxID=2984194 RepID=A0ABU9B7I4_9BURK
MHDIEAAWGNSGVLAFPIDISAVLAHMHQDMRDDWFFDPIQHQDLFANQKSLKEVVTELLLEGNGRYLGSIRQVYDIPKKGLGIRYSLETDFYDRFVYQAVCSYLIPFFDPILSPRVLGHRYNKRRKEEKYLFKNRIELWRTFEGVTYTALRNDQALLATDLINYFENISVELIQRCFETALSTLEATGPEKLKIRNAIQTLCELLTRWGYSSRHGLPQNRDASSFIANVVLNSVDHKMCSMNYDYFRYVDDIRIICKSAPEAKRALIDLIAELRTVGMNINSAKTKILTSTSSESEIADFFPNSDDRSVTIDNMWRSRSRRTIARSATYIFQLLEECIAKKETQSRQFRFAVNRLCRLADAKLFDIQSPIAAQLVELILESLEDHPASTDQYCRLLSMLNPPTDALDRIERYLRDHSRSIHSWQNYHLWFVIAKRRHKTEELVELANLRITNQLLAPEVPAIFVYLSCVGESARLAPLVERFSTSWPYYHQRCFLLATSDLDRADLKPLVEKLGPKVRNTVHRALPYFKAGKPIAEPERSSVINLYDDISPYD